MVQVLIPMSGVKKSRSSKRRKHINSGGKEHDDWSQMSSSRLWERIKADADSYYAFMIDGKNIDAYLSEAGIQKTSFLRRFAQMMGIQVLFC